MIDHNNQNGSLKNSGSNGDKTNDYDLVWKDLFNNNEYLYIQEKTAAFKHELINDIARKSEKFKQDIENAFVKKATVDKDKNNNNKIVNKKKEMPQEKVFQMRESLLTELFKISHIRTLRHIFISILLILLFQVVIYDLKHKGSIDLDFSLFKWCFKDFKFTIMYVWIPMKLSSIIAVYYGFYTWAYLRSFAASKLKNKSVVSFFDYTFLFIYIIYQIMFIYVPLDIVTKISIACRLIILLEQVRLLMKTHAFIRHNTPRVLNATRIQKEKHEDDNNNTPSGFNSVFPQYSKYFYFMFAPTLVYRDEYPRTSAVSWRLVITHLIEMLGSIVYTYYLFDRFCVPLFRDLNIKDLTIGSYVYLISICIMPGALIQFMTFFAFLHAWHNAWAEMLRFGDRQFYLDWWNSTSYNKYYRTWNNIVQDWLHTYIYRDMYQLFGGKYRPLSQFMVIFISSIFHEHIFTFAFGFFYPIMFFLFSGFGFICLFIPRGSSAVWNVFIWTSLFTGIGIQIAMFSIEWFARNTSQCPRIIESMLDYMIPRSISC